MCSKVIFEQIQAIISPSQMKTQKLKKRKVPSKFDRVFHLLELVKGTVASTPFLNSLHHLRTGYAGASAGFAGITFSNFFRRSKIIFIHRSTKMGLFEETLKSMKIRKKIKIIDFFKMNQLLT